MCKISILVPIYNVEKYIAKCAKSLFEQSFDNIEFIFVNDCTKDKSVEVLKRTLDRYPNRRSQVKIINHEKNTGLGGARLTGLNNATGDYVWCVDSDDWVENDAIEKIVPFIEKGHDYIVFNYYEEKREGSTKFYNKPLTVDNVLYSAVSPSIWKSIVRKSLFFDNSILPVIGINQSEDFLLTSRLILVAKAPILVSDLFLYHYNLSNVNSYVNNITVKSLENCSQTCFIVKDFYQKQGKLEEHKVCLAIRMARWYIDFYSRDKNNDLCKKLGNEIRELDLLISLITKLSFLNREKLLRVIKKIKLREKPKTNYCS